MSDYYDVIQLKTANESPCEQIGVKYGEQLVVLRNLQDALTFLYCENFFLNHADKWRAIDDSERLSDIDDRIDELTKAINVMEKELERDDYIFIEKLLGDEAEERNWEYSIELYDFILRTDERYV